MTKYTPDHPDVVALHEALENEIVEYGERLSWDAKGILAAALEKASQPQWIPVEPNTPLPSQDEPVLVEDRNGTYGVWEWQDDDAIWRDQNWRSRLWNDAKAFMRFLPQPPTP